LAGLERKNGRTLAEHTGAVSPDGMQQLLRTAGWNVDGVHDDLRGKSSVSAVTRRPWLAAEAEGATVG
jgi:hypothetical protein